jgi:hypothetical protein
MAEDDGQPTLPDATTMPGPVSPGRDTDDGLRMQPGTAIPGLAPPGQPMQRLPDDAMYRQPLSMTSTQDLPYDPRDADEAPGARELQNNNSAPNLSPDPGIPPTSGVGASDPTITDPAYTQPAQPAPSYRYEGEASDVGGPAQGPAAPPEPESPFKPLYDAGGRVIGYVQGVAQAVQQNAPAALESVVATAERGAGIGYPSVNPVTAARTAAGFVAEHAEPAGGAGRITARMREIEEQAARETGRAGDPSEAIVRRGVNDPVWRAANPELATEYDQLKYEFNVNVGGVTGDIRPSRKPARAASEFAQSAERGVIHEAPTGSPTWALPEGTTEVKTPISAGLSSGYSPDDIKAFYVRRRWDPAWDADPSLIPATREGFPAYTKERAVQIAEQDFARDLAREPEAVQALVEVGQQRPTAGGGIGQRIRGALEANAERTAAADARMARQGSMQLPGTLGVITDNPMEASRAARTRVVPPEVADQLDFPVRVPDDPAVIRAIEAAGGTVDPERGVTMHVIRQQGPEAHGGEATRDTVFYTAGKPGEASPYAAGPNAQVGGSERIEGWTRFRSPLILDGPPGGAAFDSGMRDLGYQISLVGRLPSQEIDAGIRQARAAGPEGSPARAQALKDLVSRYGGNPDRIEPLLAVRGADASESAWAIKENILAGNARRQGYDGVVTVQPHGADNAAVMAHPAVVAAEQAVKDATATEDAAFTAVNELYRAGKSAKDPEYAAAWQKYEQASTRTKSALVRAQDAEQQARRELSGGRITELADVREARNPTPGAPNPAVAELERRVNLARERFQSLLSATHHSQRTPEQVAEIREARRAVEVGEEHLGLFRGDQSYAPSTPGYELRSDIPRRPETRVSTITENPKVAEANRAVEVAQQALEDAKQAYGDANIANMRAGNLGQGDSPEMVAATKAWDDAAKALEQAKAAQRAALEQGRYVTDTTPPRPRIAPEDQARATRGPGLLSALGRTANTEALNAAGGAFAGNVVSGDLTPTENDTRTPEERARDALIHGGVGALAAIGLRHGRRFVGRVPEGTLASLGNVPNGPRRRLRSQAIPEGAQAIKMTPAEEVGRLRLDKFPEPLRPAIQQAAEASGFAHEARRGVIPDAAAEQAADSVGRSVDDWIARSKVGQSLNTEETRALRNLVTGQAQKVDDLAQEIAEAEQAGVVTDLLISRAHQEGEKLASLVSVMEGARAEAGRSMRAWRAETRPTDPAEAAQQIFKKFGGGPEGRQRALDAIKELNEIPVDDPIARAQFWARIQRGGTISNSDILTAIRYNSMLSSPRTWEVGWVGSILQAPIKIASDVLAAGRRPLSGELGEAAKGAAMGAQAGLRPLWETIWHGITSDQALAGQLPRGLAARATSTPGKVAGTLVDLPGRMVAAPDAFFTQLFRGMETGRQAAISAYKAGLKGEERARFIQQFATNLPKEADAEITRVVDDLMLRGDMGRFGRWASGVATKDPLIGSFVAPFMKVSYHIWTQGMDLTPVGAVGTGIDVLRGAYRGGQRPQGVRPLGERARYNAIGLGITGAATWQALQGNVSGLGPDDPEKRDELRATGWQPYSVKIGNNWVSYANWGPVAVPLSLAAAYAENQQYKKPGAKPEEQMFDMAKRVTQLVTEQTFLQGIGTIMNAFEDPQRYLPQLLGQQTSSLIPYGSALNTVGQSQDDVQRRPERPADVGTVESVGQSIKGRIPMNPLTPDRGDVPVAQDPLGRPVENQQSGPMAFQPFRISRVKDDRSAQIARAFLDVGVDLARPPSSFTSDGVKIEMTPEQQRAYQRYMGDAIIQGFERANGASDRRRAEQLKSLYEDARAAAAAKVQAEIGRSEIRNRVRAGAGR